MIEHLPLKGFFTLYLQNQSYEHFEDIIFWLFGWTIIVLLLDNIDTQWSYCASSINSTQNHHFKLSQIWKKALTNQVLKLCLQVIHFIRHGK